MARKASIEWIDDQWFAIYSPFDRAFVDALKDGTRTRRWDQGAKRWECLALEYERALRLMQRFFDVVDEPEWRPGRSPYDVLGVRRDAPMEVIEAAYRAMTKLHHPDMHGYQATGRMATVNAAMDTIRRDRA